MSYKSYYQPYNPKYRNFSHSQPPTHFIPQYEPLYSTNIPRIQAPDPIYVHEYPEYPPPPVVYRPLQPYSYQSQPNEIIRAVPIKDPPEIIQEPLHGNFFKDPNRIFRTDYEILINAMKEQIILLRDLEKIKEKLAFTEDFHISFIYYKFDDNNSKAITLKEFKQGLNNMGVSASEKDSYLVLRQHVKDNNNRLDPKEFDDLFIPRSGFMKKKLENVVKNEDYIFKQETMELCKKVLEIHVRLETAWEKLKQKLQLRKTNMNTLFKFLDSDQNEGLEPSDLKEILEKNNMIPADWELEFVFRRFVEKSFKKNEEKIGFNKLQIRFNEFLKELTTTPSPPVIKELEKFINFIKEQMEFEKLIEQKKAELTKMREYDFEKFYKIFDENDSGSISYSEFRLGVTEKFEIKANEDDIIMIFQTFNINDDGKLTKQEFWRMMSPSDAQILPARFLGKMQQPTKKNEGNYKFLIEQVFKYLIDGEKAWKTAKRFFQGKNDELKLLFKQMDYDRDDLLKESDFKSFLQETGFMANSSEISALIRRFDRNGDCNIDLEEFLSELGQEQKRKKIEIDFSDELVGLFKGIQGFFNKIEKAKANLFKRYDFNFQEIIELFDDDKTGQISIHEMKKGFSMFGVDVQDKECYLLCRRFSAGKNYFLNYDEFADLFNPMSNIRKPIELPSRKYLTKHKIDNIISYETKQYLNTLFLLLQNFEIYWNGIKTTMQQKKFDVAQAFKNLDQKKDGIIDLPDLESFVKKNDLQFDKIELLFILFLFEPRLTGQISLETFKIELSPIERFDEVAQKVSILEDISEILREIIKACREIEGYKQNLNKHEFNYKELFQMLDFNGGGVLNKVELLAGLKHLGIEISDAECRILMREYCIDNDLEVMNFQCFKQMFLPLNSMGSSADLAKDSSRLRTIKNEDVKNIQIFFKNIVQAERKVEKFRQSLIEKKVDLMKIFKILDAQNDGFLSGEDFIKFIIKSDISSNKSDINLLVSRFDKDKSGTISREEFILELIPTPASFGDKGGDAELLKDIFTEQLIRLKVLEQRRLELLRKKNFKIWQLFQLFDESNSGVLTNIELRESLLDIFEINTTWEDINLLINKYSKQKDELIMSLDDFKRIFIPIAGDYKNTDAFNKPVGKANKEIDEGLKNLIGRFFVYLISYETYMRILRKELENKRSNLNKLYSLLNIKKTQQITWENFKEFALKYEIADTEDDIKLLFAVYDTSDKGKLSEQEFVNELKPRNLNNLLNKRMENFEALKTIMREMKRICRIMEKWRQTLALQSDFRLINLFQMFDYNESEQIGKSEIMTFFKKKGIFTNEKLIDLIMNRYSLDNNELMGYEEFGLMLMPAAKQKNFDKILETNRSGYNFSKDTWNLIKKTFQILSEGERELEILRQDIKNQDIHLEALFHIIDIYDKNQITREYFAEFLNHNKILIYPLDIKCLIKRLDKKNTGYIKREAFLEELKPTISHKN